MGGIAVSTIILAAGFGTRMKSARAKVLHEIGGRALLGHVMDAAAALHPAAMAIVVGEHAPETGEFAKSQNASVNIFIQSPPQGTGDAVKQAMPALDRFDGAALVLFADTPLIRSTTLRALAAQIENGAAVAVLGFAPSEPGQYGRLKTSETGDLEAIIEAADASDEERAITLCNSGVMGFDASFLKDHIGAINNNNAKGEYYLTDLVAIARAQGKRCAIVNGDADEVVGVNSREDLAAAEAIFQWRRRRAAMIDGATLLDPATVYFSFDTTIGKDVTIGQNVVFGPGVSIADNVSINPFTHIQGARVASDAVVGPFARLRPGADIHDGARVGNFVEVKNAQIKDGAKVNHLSYVGDAVVGRGANIGAGTITCNYDGFAKHKTEIGDGAFVGSGSVITKDVDAGDLAVARGRQSVIKGWAARFKKVHTKKSEP